VSDAASVVVDFPTFNGPRGFQGDKGDTGDGISTLASMANVSPSADDSFILSEQRRAGTFHYRTGNFTAAVTADPLQGIYVPLASDPTGASGCWVRSFVGTVYPSWWGAAGDGVTNDTAALQSAITLAGPRGATVAIDDRHLVDTDLIVTANVTLRSRYGLIETPKDNASYPYDGLAGIILNPLATIRLKGGATIDGVLIQRKGIAYPATVSAFAGTAITIEGDGAYIANSAIFGFDQAIKAIGYQRPRIGRVNIDCNNGIYLENAFDVPYLAGVHCWPFTNVGSGALTTAHRPGAAFKFVNSDWPKLTDCFAFGYYRGIHSDGSDDLIAVNCSVDGTQLLSGSIGVLVENDALRNQFVGLKVSSQDIGVYVSTTLSAISRTQIIGAHLTTSAAHALFVNMGDVAISASTLIGAPYGVSGTAVSSRFTITGNRFGSISHAADQPHWRRRHREDHDQRQRLRRLHRQPGGWRGDRLGRCGLDHHSAEQRRRVPADRHHHDQPAATWLGRAARDLAL
jgi:hypothetical protein